jgi:hypothetical protein
MTKQEAISYINTLSDNVDLDITILNQTITSGEVEKLGISRQLLKYYVSIGKVRTEASGKQSRYVLDDIKKLKKCK